MEHSGPLPAPRLTEARSWPSAPLTAVGGAGPGITAPPGGGPRAGGEASRVLTSCGRPGRPRTGLCPQGGGGAARRRGPPRGRASRRSPVGPVLLQVCQARRCSRRPGLRLLMFLRVTSPWPHRALRTPRAPGSSSAVSSLGPRPPDGSPSGRVQDTERQHLGCCQKQNSNSNNLNEKWVDSKAWQVVSHLLFSPAPSTSLSS